MTVSSTKITAGPYAGNGVSDTFSYKFGLEDKSEIKVFETDALNVETELVVDNDYIVNDIGVQTGGTVTRVAGPLPSGHSWYMRSNYPETQATEFESQGAFFPDIHEKAMDKLTRLVQQITDIQERSPRLSEGYSGTHDLELPDPIDGEIMIYTATGIEGTTVSDIRGDLLSKSGGDMVGGLGVIDTSAQNTAMPRGSINTLVENAIKAVAGFLPGVNEDYGFINESVTELKDYGNLI